MNEIKERLTVSLLKILDLDVTKVLKLFLEGEISVLFLLFRTQKTYSPTEIAKELDLSKGRVATLLNSLYDKGHIEIEMSASDRRSFNVSLTKKGLLVLSEKMMVADGYFDKLVNELGVKKTTDLVDILDEAVEIMKEE